MTREHPTSLLRNASSYRPGHLCVECACSTVFFLQLLNLAVGLYLATRVLALDEEAFRSGRLRFELPSYWVKCRGGWPENRQ